MATAKSKKKSKKVSLSHRKLTATSVIFAELEAMSPDEQDEFADTIQVWLQERGYQ